MDVPWWEGSLPLASPPHPHSLGASPATLIHWCIFSAHHLSYDGDPRGKQQGVLSEAGGGRWPERGASGRLVGKKVEECGLQEVSALLLLSQRRSSLCTWVLSFRVSTSLAHL